MFFTLLPPTPKNPKHNKLLEISSFYTSVPKTTIIWGMVPDIWSEADRSFVILGHFLSFYPPSNLENQNFELMKKKHLEISSFYTGVPLIMVICYTVPGIWTQSLILHQVWCRINDCVHLFWHFKRAWK